MWGELEVDQSDCSPAEPIKGRVSVSRFPSSHFLVISQGRCISPFRLGIIPLAPQVLYAEILAVKRCSHIHAISLRLACVQVSP